MVQERVDHPDHYGGADNPHEAIKCITAHELGFSLGNAVKYIFRAGKKVKADHSDLLEASIEDLKKARWYIDWQIEQLTNAQQVPF